MPVSADRQEEMEQRAAVVAPLLARMLDKSDGRYVPLDGEDDPDSPAGQLVRAIYGEDYQKRVPRCRTSSSSIVPTFPAS